jgi:hypothetical protein
VGYVTVLKSRLLDPQWRRPKNQLVCAPQKFRRYTLSFDNVL